MKCVICNKGNWDYYSVTKDGKTASGCCQKCWEKFSSQKQKDTIAKAYKPKMSDESLIVLFTLMSEARNELSKVLKCMDFDDYRTYADEYELLESEIMASMYGYRNRARLLRNRMSIAVGKHIESQKQIL